MKTLKSIFLIFIFIFIFSVILNFSLLYAFPNRNIDCFKCHSLKKDEALEILKKLVPDIKIINIKKDSIRYLWEIGFETKGRKGIVYIDLPKKRIISGNIIEIGTKRNLTEESLSDINKVDISKIPLGDALVLGNKDATYKVIVFDDPE